MTEQKIGMTFNMPKDWHTTFKMTATMNGMNMTELLFEAFEAWMQVQSLKVQMSVVPERSSPKS